MSFFLQHKKILSVLLLISFSCLTVYFSPAQARLIPTAKVLKEGSPGSERARLNAFLEREEVQNQLEAWAWTKQWLRPGWTVSQMKKWLE